MWKEEVILGFEKINAWLWPFDCAETASKGCPKALSYTSWRKSLHKRWSLQWGGRPHSECFPVRGTEPPSEPSGHSHSAKRYTVKKSVKWCLLSEIQITIPYWLQLRPPLGLWQADWLILLSCWCGWPPPETVVSPMWLSQKLLSEFPGYCPAPEQKRALLKIWTFVAFVHEQDITFPCLIFIMYACTLNHKVLERNAITGGYIANVTKLPQTEGPGTKGECKSKEAKTHGD